MAKPGKPARDAGIRWERAVAHWLGTVTTRSRAQGSHDDGGDVVLGGYVVECKDHARWNLMAWWLHLESKLKDGDTPLLILKRRGHPTGDALVVTRLRDYWPEEDAP